MVYPTINVLGGNGFIGSNLVRDLSGKVASLDNNISDIFINANGNSSKLLPETNPLLDFDLTVRKTLESIIDYNFDTYIYISSCEVYGDEEGVENKVLNPDRMSRYAFSKYVAECLVRKHCKKWIILRLNGPVGLGLKKGPIYDILYGDKLWISAESQFQFIHTSYISTFISKLLEKNIYNEIFNITGYLRVSLNDIMCALGKYVPAPDDPIIKHNINVWKANSILPIMGSLESIYKLKRTI